jgi:hypothetical protein
MFIGFVMPPLSFRSSMGWLRYLAERFEVSRSRDILDFGHHQAVAEHLPSFALGPQRTSGRVAVF